MKVLGLGTNKSPQPEDASQWLMARGGVSAARWLFGLPRFVARWRPRPERVVFQTVAAVACRHRRTATQWRAIFSSSGVDGHAPTMSVCEDGTHNVRISGVRATEIDDRGIDFIARFENGPFIEVQVKSLRSMGYVFVQKEKFALRDHLYLALGILRQKRPPALYLIPATAWTETNALFVSRDYEGLKSRPEWGLNVVTEESAVVGPPSF